MKKVLFTSLFIACLLFSNGFLLNAQSAVSFGHSNHAVSSAPLIVGPTSYWGGGTTPSCIYPNFHTDSILVTVPGGITITDLIINYSYVTNNGSFPIPLSDGIFYFSTTCGQTDTAGCIVDTPGICYIPPHQDFHTILTPCFTPSCNPQSFWLYAHLSRFHGGVGCDTGVVWYSQTEYPDSQYHFSAYVEGAPIIVLSSATMADTGSCKGFARVIPSGGTAPYTYLWSPGNQTNDTIQNQCAGIYCCTVTDINGCTDSVCVVVSNSTGINNINNASSIHIYPDPNSGVFTISALAQGQIAELHDYTGRKISSQLKMDNSQLTINISTQPNGVYLVRILNKNGSLFAEKKIVKE